MSYKHPNHKVSLSDVRIITVNSKVPTDILKNELNLSRVLMHHRNCGCFIPVNVTPHINYSESYLFQQQNGNSKQDSKSNWFIVRKSVVPDIVNNCREIFPCRKYPSRQKNGFIWLFSKNEQDLIRLKHMCDEVMDNVASSINVKRDYHHAAMIKCPTSCKKDTL